MFNKVYILLLLFFAQISAKTEYDIVELKDNEERDITLSYPVLYIITKSEKSGALVHFLRVSETMGNLKDSIYYNVSDTNSIDGKDFVKPDGSSVSETISNKLKEYTAAYPIDENKYGITKFMNLKVGEKVTVKAYYMSKTAVYIIIAVVIAVVLCILCIVCMIIKKCCC